VHRPKLGGKRFDCARHCLKVFGTWHFDVVDVDGRARVASMVNDVT
jgi:hypothetical protein